MLERYESVIVRFIGRNIEYKVGDFVEVIHAGTCYTRMKSFFEETMLNNLLEDFTVGSIPYIGSFYEILLITKHPRLGGIKLALIKI